MTGPPRQIYSLLTCNDHAAPSVVERAVKLLKQTRTTLQPGLSSSELDRLEQELTFRFSDEHRDFLSRVLPVGDAWPDWRSGDREALAGRIAWPVDGTLFDVRENGFWPRSWGERPAQHAEAEVVARTRLADVPRLVPVYSHRYLPAGPAGSAAPVFSVHQADVIYYGDDLADYIAYEFKLPEASRGNNPRVRVPFWSDLAEGAENEDL